MKPLREARVERVVARNDSKLYERTLMTEHDILQIRNRSIVHAWILENITDILNAIDLIVSELSE